MKYFSLVIALLLAIGSVAAQKVGYVNSTLLLQQLEMVKKADAELNAIQTKYIKDGEAKVLALEQEYKSYLTEVNQGLLSKKQREEREGQLEAKRQDIIGYDTKAKVAAEAQREALFRPILQLIDQAIQTIGQEEGFDLIMDSGMGHLLYKTDAQDITDKVKARLEP